MKKKVLFFPFYISSPWHFGTDCELILREINAGNDIYVINCKGELDFCLLKVIRKYRNEDFSCKQCVCARKHIFSFMSKYSKCKINFININLPKVNYEYGSIDSADSLIKLQYKNFPVGYCVASTLSNFFESQDFSVFLSDINSMIKGLVNFYEFVITVLEKKKIDLSYTFNGRFDYTRAFLCANLQKNVDIFLHERGANFEKYMLYKNAMPHDKDLFYRNVIDCWIKNKDSEEYTVIANSFFADNVNGKTASWLSHVQEQKKSMLPEEISRYKKIVAIFSSSDFEYKYTGCDYNILFYKSQNEGIAEIAKSLLGHPEIGVFVREHPNMKRYSIDDSKQRKELHSIKFDNLHIIPSESPVDSYSLLKHSNVVVTFNSTMGIEATYWGVPSINCANSIYEQLKIAYMPKSHEELIQLLLSDLTPLPKNDALKYGYFINTFGYDFQFFKPKDLFRGSFLDQEFCYTTLYDRIKNKYGILKRWLKKILKKLILWDT